MADRTCSVPGCDRKHRCRGFCNAHYMRWRVSGDPGPAEIGAYTRRDRTCSVDGCDREVWSRGWCGMHYHRLWRNNDPEQFGPPEQKQRDIRSDVSYHHVHVRLRAERGRASEYTCGDGCGRQAKHWAYDHSDPNELHSPEGYPYSIDPGNYWPLCPSCHARHDRRSA